MAREFDFTALDLTEVARVQAVLVARFAETHPEFDLNRGALRDLVIRLGAYPAVASTTAINAVTNATSLAKIIAADPTLVDTVAADALLADRGVVRGGAAVSSGQVLLVFSSLIPIVLPSGLTFTAGGIDFATAGAIALRISTATATGPTDRVLAPSSDGLFRCVIPVLSTTGSTAAPVRGTPMSPSSSIPYLTAATAAIDFTAGTNQETIIEAVTRVLAGMTPKTWGSRLAIDAMVRTIPGLERIPRVAVVGAGDPEMTRDRRGLLPIAGLGRVDVYPRTAPIPVAVPVLVNATLLSTSAAASVWQMTIGRVLAPGFYTVSRISRVGAPETDSLTILSETRGVDLPSGEGTWDITAVESVYSNYQTAVVTYLDPATTESVGQVITVAVVLTALPQIADIQALLGSRDSRPAGANVLVKAPIPCYLSCTIEVFTSSVVDNALVSASVATAVGLIGPSSKLFHSAIATAAQAVLPAAARIGSIELFGRIRRRDGTTLFLHDPHTPYMQIPTILTAEISPTTVAIYLNPADVAIALRTDA